MLDLEGAPNAGATMGARLFANYHVDIGVGDATNPPLEILQGGDGSNLPASQHRALSQVLREQQWAEKRYACMRPKQQRPNSRAKNA